MRESELLAHIEARSADLSGLGAVVVGPGDDAAVLSLPGQVLATVDQAVAGRHFDLATASLDQVARKAVARSVSDIAAMGGTPTCGLATGCLPPGFEDAAELFDRMASWGKHFGCPLVGGDICVSDGPLVLTVAVLGRAHASRGPVLRSGARAGDSVWVTGRIGGSLASGRHMRFEPRLAEAGWLCDELGPMLHAMIDLSDGLGRDAGRVAKASGVRFEIDAAAIPLHDGVRDWRQGAGDGEDYELLFCVDSGAALPAACPRTGVRLHRIGHAIEGSGCVIRTPTGEAIDARSLGWDHAA